MNERDRTHLSGTLGPDSAGVWARRGSPRRVWYAGRLDELRRIRVGVVGSRRPTVQQRRAAEAVALGFAQAGALVCSGGAMGVDADAHRAALRAGAATGLFSPVSIGSCHPPSHRELFDDVARRGLILSPFAPGQRIHISHFRRRNRLLAQSVDALIVICAELRSGTVHCAREAWRLGVPVFVCPWTAGSPNAAGPTYLSSHGARALSPDVDAAASLAAALIDRQSVSFLSREAVLPPTVQGAKTKTSRRRSKPSAIDGGGLGWQRYAPVDPEQGVTTSASTDANRGPDERLLWDVLRQAASGLSVEELIDRSQLPRSTISRQLLQWVLRGDVKRDAYGRYRLNGSVQTE